MALTNDLIFNFASGELSPKVRGRFDLAIYQSGCERLQNFIAEVQGPARYRDGFRFVHHTRGNAEAILLPFQFNDEQSYLLEFTDLKMRIYKDEGIIVESTKTITVVTQADPVVITATAHGYANGDEVYIVDVGGMTEINGKFYLVADKTTDTFELTDIDGTDIDGTGFTAYTSGGTCARVVEVTTPYTEAQLSEIKLAQNADTMYFVHPSHAPRKLTRSSHTSWTLATFVRTSDPFTGANEYPGAVAFYEGRIVYAGTNNSPETFWLSRAPNTAGAPRYDDLTGGTADDDAMAFTLAPQNGQVDSIQWLAATTRFLALGTFGGVTRADGGLDTIPITPTSINVKAISSHGVADRTPVFAGNSIIYVDRSRLIIRSLEYDFNSDSYIATDRNLVADHMTASGVRQVAFQNGRPDVMWAAKDNGELIGLTFKAKEDVSGWHRHTLAGSGLVSSVGVIPQVDNYDQIWVVVKRTINGVTRRYVEFMEDAPVHFELLDHFSGENNKEADTTKYLNLLYEHQRTHFHLDSGLSFDGALRGSDAGASVTPAAVTGSSVVFTASASVFTAADVGNEIWKKFNTGLEAGRAKILSFTSATEVTCQVLTDFDSTDAVAAGDWYLTVGSLSGLDHLEGEEIGLVTDGSVHPNETVSSGSVTLDYQAAVVHMGLRYTGILKTTNLEIKTKSGPTQTKTRNVTQAGIRFLGTLGAKFGTSVYKLQTLLFRSTGDATDRPAPLFSGVKFVEYGDTWDREKHAIVVQESPLPCVVQQIDIYMDTAED